MNNDFDNYTSSSSESESEEETGNDTFMNLTNKEDYEKQRNELYTQNIVKKTIVIDSHNYQQGENFDTSNFQVLFDFEKEPDLNAQEQLVTTNYNIYNNVIGFKLMRTTIRTPPYNINKTNNIIYYKREGTGNTIHTITINPGTYNASQLADVFQKYREKIYSSSLIGENNSSERATVVDRNLSQFVSYSDQDIYGNESWGNVSQYGQLLPGGYPTDSSSNQYQFWSIRSAEPGGGSFTLKVKWCAGTKLDHDLSDLQIAGGLLPVGNVFEFSFHRPGEEITILWNYNNVSRGLARVLGFVPRNETTVGQKLYSTRSPDFGSHFVDVVIPEIPSIICKRNSSGKDIIDRIQLSAGHGEYLHYRTQTGGIESYFTPMKLHRLNIQLWAVNNLLYDTNNSDVSFEFEITMLKNPIL